jgi:putative transposase
MPAQNTQRTGEGGTYVHVYNRGVENRIIFNDEEDYAVFLGYLNDYLTPPTDPRSAKKAFTVNGRTFHGVPHQPKNYFDKVELLAYSLMPNHFHLLLHQKTQGSLQNFLRSLCTRYSMYFNKKYQRSGALFAGPYKSVHIKDTSGLLHLTRYLHREGSCSSYKEFLGTKTTAWVKPGNVLTLKGAHDYKNFVEKYEPNEKEKKLLAGIILESEPEYLEKTSNPARSQLYEKPTPKTHFRILELIATVATFFLLLGLGIRNIRASANKIAQPSSTPSVSGTKDEESIVTEETKPIVELVIKISDGSESVNIRQAPTIQSEKIGEAKDGETFKEFTAVDEKWYQIKLADGSTGFVSARYAVEIKGEN